ncbi:hypothetical protein D1165_09710 [Muribaculaceae bacterium M3]|nr:hypothetical protein [Muribaculaceae bacterium M3]
MMWVLVSFTADVLKAAYNRLPARSVLVPLGSEKFFRVFNRSADRVGIIPQANAHIIFGQEIERRENPVILRLDISRQSVPA